MCSYTVLIRLGGREVRISSNLAQIVLAKGKVLGFLPIDGKFPLPHPFFEYTTIGFFMPILDLWQRTTVLDCGYG